MPKTCMSFWLEVPEFTTAMLEVRDSGRPIDDRLVYDIMVDIYNKGLEDKEGNRARGYNFKKMRQGINHLKRALGLDQQDV